MPTNTGSEIERNKALFYHWFGEVWNKGNYAVAHEVISPRMRVHGAGGQPVEQGPDGVVGLVKTWRAAFPDGQMSIDGLVAEGDLVTALLTWHGTHKGEFYGIPPSGKTIACTSIGIDRIQNGIIVDGWGELDMVGMMQQMGAMPLVGPGAVAQGRSPEWGQGSGVPADPAPSAAANKALLQRLLDASNTGDQAVFTQVIDTARYVEHNPVWGAIDYGSSLQVVGALFAAMPDLRYAYATDLTTAEGDKVVSHAVASGTHTGAPLFGAPASGKKITWTQSDLGRVANGKIVERWFCADSLALLQQIGALPTPG
jgi:predicted ester cyclase